MAIALLVSAVAVVRRVLIVVLVLWLLVASTACNTAPKNPSFPITQQKADRAMAAMAESPKPVARPVVIITGWLDPGIASMFIANELKHVTTGARIISVSVPAARSFDACRDAVIAAVDRAAPSNDAEATTEVDVIAISMGGLVGRYAAEPIEAAGTPRRRLRVARMFTISSPHRGARLASLAPFSGLEADMCAGSAFLEQLNTRGEAARGYPIYPYVRLDDRLVGAASAAPPGAEPWWVENPPLESPHAGAVFDKRILADIFMRLRDETPFSRVPAAPLPAQ